MEREDQLILNEELEPQEQEDQTSIGIYEDIISLLSDPSQMLYRAVESGQDEYLTKWKCIQKLQKLDGTSMPYIRDP